MKLLIDENLSEALAKRARELGHAESSHVRWIGKGGIKDWNLISVILEGDWTFVTRNADDFRGPFWAPGSRGEYRKTTVHAGLICLNGPSVINRAMQLTMLEAALETFTGADDLINQVIEVTLTDVHAQEMTVDRYTMPEK